MTNSQNDDLAVLDVYSVEDSIGSDSPTNYGTTTDHLIPDGNAHF